MNRIAITLLCACVSLALASCGQKGPLYLPDEGGTIITRPGGPADEAGQARTGTEAEEESAEPAEAQTGQPR